MVSMTAPLAFLGGYLDHWYQWVAIIGLIVLIIVWVQVRKKQ
jgi:hypothetical protein